MLRENHIEIESDIDSQYNSFRIARAGRGARAHRTSETTMNFQSGTVEQAPSWTQPTKAAPGLRAFAPPSYRDKMTGKRRGLAALAAIGIQALMGLAMVYGTFKGVTMPPAPPMIVDIIEQTEDVKPPPPPMKPPLHQPQFSMNLPEAPQIYEPPPLVQVQQAPPSPIKVVATPVRSDPNAAIQTFQQRMLHHVNSNLRYPAQARSSRHEGIVVVRFKMDRRGNIITAAIEKPCGYEALNAEGVAVLNRAQPFPAPPPEIEGDPIEMILPVKFSLKDFGRGRRG